MNSNLMKIVFILDISKSMEKEEILLEDDSFLTFFKISPKTSHEKFLSFLNYISPGMKISKLACAGILLQTIKELLSERNVMVAIVWFNHIADNITFSGGKVFISLSGGKPSIRKTLSLALIELSKRAFGGSNIYLGVLKAKKIVEVYDSYHFILVSDGLWNCGISPIKFVHDEKISLSSIQVSSSKKPQNLFMEKLAKVGSGKFLYIQKLNSETLKNIENWTSHIY